MKTDSWRCQRWTTTLALQSQLLRSRGVVSTLALAIVTAASANATADPRVKWQQTYTAGTAGWYITSPAIGADGTLYFGTIDCEPDGGHSRWLSEFLPWHLVC